MTSGEVPPGPGPRDRLAALDARLGPVFACLGFVFLIVVVIDLSSLPLTTWEQRWLRIAEIAIYALFLAELAIRFWLAREKRTFFRRNWASILVLALPMLRPLLVLRALPAVTSGQTLAGLAITHRGFSALRALTRGRQLVYVVCLTVAVVLLGAALTFYLEHDVPGSPLSTLGESLWWASTLVTTINSDDDPLSVQGRLVALVLRIYALSIFGYITAFIATWLIGDVRAPAVTPSPPADQGNQSP